MNVTLEPYKLPPDATEVAVPLYWVIAKAFGFSTSEAIRLIKGGAVKVVRVEK